MNIKNIEKAAKKKNKAYQKFYNMPVICPCCRKELHLITKIEHMDDERFQYIYTVCSNCNSRIHESMDVLRRNQADRKFAVQEQKEKQKEYAKTLLEKAANENFTISVDELEKFADTKINNVRILVTSDQLRSIKKSRKTKPIILNIKEEK